MTVASCALSQRKPFKNRDPDNRRLRHDGRAPPNHRHDHAHAVADAAIEMVQALQRINEKNGTELAMRVGIHSAPIVAGVIGKIKFTYDLWGDTVNVASRMESTGAVGRVHISEFTAKLLPAGFALEDRGVVDVKGVGQMSTYFVNAGPSVT